MRKHVVTCVGLFLLDAFVLGQGALTAMVAMVMISFGAIDVVRGLLGDKWRVRLGAQKMALYAALAASVFAIISASNRLARSRADQIIAALDRYKSEHGDYPTTLEALVPKHMAVVPSAKLTLLGNQFLYHYMPGRGGGFLGYTRFPPFGRRLYDLEARRWGGLD